MIKLNTNNDLIFELNKALAENVKLYGKPYCPCALEQNDDTVCMCKEFRDMDEGICHCGKFIKTKD